MRAALTTIQVMEQDGLLENAQVSWRLSGQEFYRGPRGAKAFCEVRGKGLMLGIALDQPCPDVVKQALEAGLVLNVTAD